ncbi:MarR family transcriptional regulator [Mumia sp. zg.B21]|uniref:MarR family winged helix-turn-helix transcriptional regulator n=1 Tax=Mumia sp. zg.B21 TaxID=2855447 RepID=UPI001C6ECD2B|nr:MarR family transcriptional regulator [Mumia sp. zg.B21]MBW9208129.1 MarR family transcriptional regulator [Mumia sp. zg.B21]
MAMPTLDEQLCFALYSASRAMTATYRPLLKGLGLTYPQYLVMMALWEEGRTTVGGLGEQLQLDSGTLSPLLKRLEAHGYLRRQRSTSDERVVEVVLTPAGSDLERQASGVPRQAFSATGMTAHETADLREAVRRLSEALNASRRKESE